MKIAVDLRLAKAGQKDGLAQWLQGVLEHLIPADPHNDYLLFCTPFNYHLLEAQTPNLRRVILPATRYIPQLQDRLEIEGDVDVLLRCGPYETELDFPVQRQIVCINDLRHDSVPESFKADVIRERRRIYHFFQSCAGAIAAPSEFIRDELLASPWASCEDVFLMPPALPPGHGDLGDPAADAAARPLLPDAPYLLYPANLLPHRNHRLILEAFARFHQAHPDTHFVFTGNPDGWQEYQRDFGRLPIRHLGHLSPRLLGAVFRRARALAYLSRYEGFGMPLLEAFAAGVPVLCSATASLPEVGGDAVLTCDPTDVVAMADAMQRIVADESMRGDLTERGKGRLSAYSWETSAEALREALHRVAGRSGTWSYSGGPPLVSIVTPSYAQGRFIRQTIESVLSQDYPHIDYRVVDGGSTDQTLEVLRSYGDRFPWVSETDRGQTHAINKGLALAKGQILAYLNSDDVLRPGAVSRIVDHFLKHPACDLVYGKAAFIDADDQFITMFPTAPYSFDSMLENCCISQPAAFWRDRIGREVGLFDESLYSVMDYEYWLRIDRAGGRIEYLPEVLASARIHADAKTSGDMKYRTRRFRELVDTGMKHAGRVSESFLRDHATSLLLAYHPGWLKRWPKWSIEAAQIWVRYQHVHRCRLVGVFARTAVEFAGYLVGEAITSMLTTVADLYKGHGFASWQFPRLPAFWERRLPNYLGDRVVIPPAVGRQHGELRLTGRAPCDSTVSMQVGDAPPLRVALKEGEVADLRLEREGEPVILRFSDSMQCPLRGEYAFEVMGTNLFEEKDVG